MTNQELFDKIKTEFGSINQSNLKEKSKFNQKYSYELLSLEARNFDTSKIKMKHHELSNLKEILRLEYTAITDFEEKFLFWYENQGDLKYEDSPHQKLRKKIQATKDWQYRQNPNANHYVFDSKKLYKVMNLIDKQDEIKGIQEPTPTIDQDKAFVAKYWLDYQLSIRKNRNVLIYDFEVFKKDFESKTKDYLIVEDKILFAQKKIEKITERITNQVQVWKVAHGVSDVYLCKGEPDKSDEKEPIEYFFEDYVKKMHNEQKVLLLLYKCSKINYLLYEYASCLIPFYQCKRFLESYIKQQENSKIEQNNSVASNLQPKVPTINTKIELITYAYFLEVINGTKRVYPFGRGKVEIEVYQDTIQDFGITDFEITDKDSVPNDNAKKTILINRQKVTDKAMQRILEKVKTILLQKHLDKKDSIETAFNTYL